MLILNRDVESILNYLSIAIKCQLKTNTTENVPKSQENCRKKKKKEQRQKSTPLTYIYINAHFSCLLQTLL